MSSEPVSAAARDVAASVVLSTSAALPAKPKKLRVAAAVVAATHTADEYDLSTWSGDHPYLSVLYKRMRSHRKKLEKIKALEQAQATDGKVLNAQQVALMSTKGALTKLVAELEMLREQFVGVYRLELQQVEQPKQVAVQPTTTTLESVEQVDAARECNESVQPTDGRADVDERDVQQVEKEPVAVAVVEQETVDSDGFASVYELLKTLHVVNLHQALGKEVPMVLDFFSKVVLGNTRPPAELSYEENLLESLEEAKKYLTASGKVFACDTTYCDLRAFVDQLAAISSKASSGTEVAEAVEDVENVAAVVDETPDVPVVPAEINTMPQISFFTESQLEVELADEVVAETAVAEGHVDATESVAADAEDERRMEVHEQNGVPTEKQADVSVQPPLLSESAPAAPISFAAVTTAGIPDKHRLSPAASLGSSDNDKKELGPRGSSLPGKTPRRRGQERWKEKDSNSNSGGSKSGNGSPTNGNRPRRTRAARTNDEAGAAPGGRRSGSKEDGGRFRVSRGVRKQNQSPQQQQHTGSLLAPHA
ncbi:unnamed protein product [Hyaloperonospora brassicae]|uniref:Uncharacterized protein n=1 Tax=Hyaloperonospora brassicae TaxID=162125 RepID=A0AAV0TFP4_HYABA|nr:unnamed protein product [Hyaloperonospora brassicae]